MSSVSPGRSAAIIAIGTEMLSYLRQDTNSLWLTEKLEEIGITVVRKSIVPDDPEAIGDEIDFSARSAALILTTGGLGPTADDLTVAAIAKRLRLTLKRNEEYLEKMRERFARRGIRMAATNEKQADFIVEARLLENPRGTAPGFWIEKDGTEYIILPGVPLEMREIMEAKVLPVLRERTGRSVARRRVLRISGMGESTVEEMVTPVYARWKEHPVTILASPGEVQLHLRVVGEPEESARRLDDMEADFRGVLGSRIFSREGEELAASVGRLLRERGRTLAVAESCTGGLISKLLTDVPGSSHYFLGGVVSYADSAKEQILSVSPDTLAARGAVSGETALEMARGARERFGSDLAVAVTGIAGPEGGTPTKPVGTVHFALVGGGGGEVEKKREFLGDRAAVRQAAAQFALELVRRSVQDA
ncbi:MAG TPA: competence/damage-inducible protein A [Thermoanaerobaculia bacterium]|nr:competence/damage-inducible protein A [Thermoanaerobaculia bacterium]